MDHLADLPAVEVELVAQEHLVRVLQEQVEHREQEAVAAEVDLDLQVQLTAVTVDQVS